MHSHAPDAESRRSTDAGPVTQLACLITGRAYSLNFRQRLVLHAMKWVVAELRMLLEQI
jgi:hypothetical protein